MIIHYLSTRTPQRKDEITLTFLVLIISACIVFLCQAFRFLAVTFLKPLREITIIEDLLQLTYAENRGAAFGVFANHKWIFITSTIISISFVLYLLVIRRIKNKLFLASSALIIGGGSGNLIERMFSGYVVDYIRWLFFPAICNFADYCISLGAILLAIYVLFFLESKKKDKKEEIKIADK